MNELKLEVGQYYRTRRGELVKIVGTQDDPLAPFVGECGDFGPCYLSNGRMCNQSELLSDLVSEEKEPTSVLGKRTPGKWAGEIIHHYMFGHAIESKPYGSSHWEHDPSPAWSDHNEYRVRPKPAPPLKPNEIIYREITADNSLALYGFTLDPSKDKPTGMRAVRIEFNPNDQTLVSAEVVTL